MRTLLVFVMLLLSVAAQLDAYAEPAREAPAPGTRDGRSEYDFGLHLFSTGDYYRAIGAFKRYSFFLPDTVSDPRSSYMVPLAEYAAGRYGDAVGGFDRFSRTAAPGRLRDASRFCLARCWDRLGQHEAAQVVYRDSGFEDPELRERAGFGLAWSRLLARDWRLAGQSMSEFVEAFPEAANRGLATRIADDMAVERPFQQKSKTLGGLFSTIPGGGQLYAGRPVDALYSAILVGVSGLIAVRGANEDASFALALGAVLTFTFYAGNIYGGVNAVETYNANQIDQRMRSYEAELRLSAFDDPILPEP